jgi:hypothetical protein
MIATDALLVIAFCLAVIAAIGVRIALTLTDIGSALDRIAAASEQRSLARLEPSAAVPTPAQSEEGLPNETEIAAVIAAAARYTAANKMADRKD